MDSLVSSVVANLVMEECRMRRFENVCRPSTQMRIFIFGALGATLSLACRAMKTGHLPHSVLTCTSSGNARHLESRHPFMVVGGGRVLGPP